MINAQTKESQASMTPNSSLESLKDGNLRFISDKQVSRNLNAQVKATATGQYPFATVLSCIDSRVPVETIFDQGIGDLFSARIAGNFVNTDILGSMEFACKLAGTKLILVLGHTSCGAVKGACDHAELGNLTSMLEKIQPAVEAVKSPADANLRNSSNLEFVDEVAKENVVLAIENIRKESEVLSEMEKNGEIKIVGGMYDLKTGAVSFY